MASQTEQLPSTSERKKKLGAGAALYVFAVILVVAGLLLLAFGQFPAVVLVLAGVGVALWGRRDLQRATTGMQ